MSSYLKLKLLHYSSMYVLQTRNNMHNIIEVVWASVLSQLQVMEVSGQDKFVVTKQTHGGITRLRSGFSKLLSAAKTLYTCTLVFIFNSPLQCGSGAQQTAARLSAPARPHQRPRHRAARTGSTPHCAGARSPDGIPWAAARAVGSSA